MNHSAWVRSCIATALLMLTAASGCHDDAPTQGGEVVVEFQAAAVVSVAPSTLLVWVKEGAGEGRKVLRDPEPIDVGDKDLFADPVTVRLTEPGSIGDTLHIYAVAVGPLSTTTDPWIRGIPLLVGARTFNPHTGTTVHVTLTEFLRSCDRDGDYFQRCGEAGCCGGFGDHPEDFVDCVDEVSPQLAGLDDFREREAREAYPFQISEIDGDGSHCGNGIDEDCSGAETPCDPSQEDRDRDGVVSADDCDDEDPLIHPGATEICGNTVDEDCDGTINCDADGDGFFTPEDCNDSDPNVNPAAAETTCDFRDDNCNGVSDEGLECNDLDFDGFDDDVDCPDGGFIPDRAPGRFDSGRNTGRAEICGNGIDEDCDGFDAPCAAGDVDRDGHIAIELGGDDCDDTDPFVHPNAAERCEDGRDQDCQGGDVACSSDNDGDGYNAGDDCDDQNPDVHPGPTTDSATHDVVEICDGLDNNCDGVIDEGNPLTLASGAIADLRCGSDVGQCKRGWNVCTRNDSGGVIVCAESETPQTEICDGLDNDCDGTTDEDVRNLCGGCEPLDHAPNVTCGTCDKNTYQCDGTDATTCDGDWTNGCGGCTQLAADPSSSCGHCGLDQYVCDDDESVSCSGDTDGNACGGCSTLTNQPGESCGTCGSGRYACDGDDTQCVGSDPNARNVCDGCQSLDHEPGGSCGECGTWECDGNNDVLCDDPGLNACGGCRVLSYAFGSDCGDCGSRICRDEDRLTCDDPGQNECGGCTELTDSEGEACGHCGTYSCNADRESLVCDDPGANACGGCATLSATVGSTCFDDVPCGEIVCDGQDDVTCIDDCGASEKCCTGTNTCISRNDNCSG